MQTGAGKSTLLVVVVFFRVVFWKQPMGGQRVGRVSVETWSMIPGSLINKCKKAATVQVPAHTRTEGRTHSPAVAARFHQLGFSVSASMLVPFSPFTAVPDSDAAAGGAGDASS